MKKGFSLVELIVVIGIIAILSGVLLATFGGGTASARAARCLSNMKNLASACQTYAMGSHYYPLAGNVVYMQMVLERGGALHQELQGERWLDKRKHSGEVPVNVVQRPRAR